MIGENNYKYINKEAPKVKINYSYSKYLGLEFIQQWKVSRKSNIKTFYADKLNQFLTINNLDNISKDFTLSKVLFSNWLSSINKNDLSIVDNVNLLVKRFEVTKKIYNEYNNLLRPENKLDYVEIENYSLFGVVLGLLFSKTKNFQYLNAHIKINDILLGWDLSNLNDNTLLIRSYSFDLEYNNVIDTLNKKNISYD